MLRIFSFITEPLYIRYSEISPIQKKKQIQLYYGRLNCVTSLFLRNYRTEEILTGRNGSLVKDRATPCHIELAGGLGFGMVTIPLFTYLIYPRKYQFTSVIIVQHICIHVSIFFINVQTKYSSLYIRHLQPRCGIEGQRSIFEDLEPVFVGLGTCFTYRAPLWP